MVKRKQQAVIGRPKADIDWKVVDEFLIAGCSGVEVAAFLGINPVTVYARCIEDNGIAFSLYSQVKSAKGDSILRAHQYNKALGRTEIGDNTLLIWLGKTRLKQVDAASQAASGNTFTIKVEKDGLGAGINISAKELSGSDNQGAESGDEKSSMGSP